jgi:hypothetical protein
VYIITRVNRKIYAYIEIVEPAGTQEPEQRPVMVEIAELQIPEVLSGAAGSNLLQRLQKQGSVILPPISFQSNDRLAGPADIESLVKN